MNRIKASRVTVTDGGMRFRLVDHFHRRHDFTGVALRLWLMLFLTASVAVCIAISVDVLAKELFDARVGLCEWADAEGMLQAKWAMWLGSSAVLALSATSLLKIVPAAAGSGLPEVKMLLCGVVLFDSFSLKAMLIKPLSLALALASSLSIGKEGPFIHCACCIAYQLVNTSWMRFHRNVKEQRELEGLIAACASSALPTVPARATASVPALYPQCPHAPLHLCPHFSLVACALRVWVTGARAALCAHLARPSVGSSSRRRSRAVTTPSSTCRAHSSV